MFPCRNMLYQNIRRIAVIFLMAVSFIINQARAEAQTEVETLRVGFMDSKGYLSRDAYGLKGVFYDYMESLSAYCQARFVYEFCYGKTCLEQIEQGKIDILANVVPGNNYGKDPFFDFPSSSIVRGQANLVVHENVSKAHKLMLIGYVNYVFSKEEIIKALNRKGFVEGLDFVLLPFVNQTVMYNAYNNRQLDGVIRPSTEPEIEGVKIAQLFTIKSYIAVKKGNTELLNRLNQAQEDLMLADTGIRSSLLNRNVIESEASARSLVLTEKEKEYLKNHPILKAVASSDEPPYSYYDEEGNHKGVIAEITNKIAADLGIAIEDVATNSPRERFDSIANGTVDIYEDFMADFSWAYSKNAVLTIPYVNVNFVQVTKKDARLSGIPQVATVAGNRIMYEQIKNLMPHAEMIYFNDYSQCLEAVNSGLAEATFIKSVSVQPLLDKLNLFNLKVHHDTMFSVPVSIAVRNTEDLILVRILNKAISYQGASLIDREFNNIVVGYESPHSLTTILYLYPGYVIAVVSGIFLIVVACLATFITSRHRSMEKIRTIAYTDPVTNLPNLHAFEERLPRYLARLENRLKNDGLFVMTVKVKALEELIALYSNEFVQNALISQSRSLIGDMKYIKRFGVSIEYNTMYALGYVPQDVNFKEELIRLSEKYSSQSSLRLEYVMGVCVLHSGDEKLPSRTFIDRSLLALRLAMRNNSQVVFYNKTSRDAIYHEKEIEDLMEKALAHNEFKLWLQPKYDIRTHKIISAEAVVRWDSPDMGFYSPNEFIDLFERNGFILQLDYFILSQAFEFQKKRRDKGLPIIPISVNQSGLHMAENGYIEKMIDVVKKYGSPRNAVELEITETAFVDYATKSARSKSISIVQKLKELEFDIAMDDFCTGYSSISMLETFPIDEIKIDRSMLLSAENSSKAKKILQTIINLGRDLKVRVVTEGIETIRQEKMLLDMGCYTGQGFMFSKPLPVERFSEFLDKNLQEHSKD